MRKFLGGNQIGHPSSAQIHPIPPENPRQQRWEELSKVLQVSHQLTDKLSTSFHHKQVLQVKNMDSVLFETGTDTFGGFLDVPAFKALAMV